MSSSSGRSITFTFRLIFLGKTLSPCLAASTDFLNSLSLSLSLFSLSLSLSLSLHSSLSYIASGKFSRQYPVSVQSCCRQVLAGCPTLACPCEGVNMRTSFMSTSLLLQSCPACLVRLIWMVFEMRGRCSYSSCFVRFCFQDFFKIESLHSCTIAVKLFLYTLSQRPCGASI